MEQEKEITLFGKKIKQSDLIKLVGLVVFIVLITAIVVAIWPTLSIVFEPGGVETLIELITSQGPLGVLILLGMQLLQIIVAFIPGEVVQIAAGMMYGPLWGSVVILVGCMSLCTSWELRSFGRWWVKNNFLSFANLNFRGSLV